MTSTDHSLRLRRRLALVMPVLQRAAAALWEHENFVDIYKDYLIMMHGIVRASVPLMERCAALCAGRPDDEVCRGLLPYLEEHIPEERGHERWVQGDLEALGLPPEIAEDALSSVSVAALVGSQYYWMSHVHPCALLGYIAVLEGYPVSPEHVEGLKARSGLPAGAFRSLELHARLDPGHRDAFDHLLDGLPLGERHRALIGVSALTTVEMTVRAIDEVVRAGSP